MIEKDVLSLLIYCNELDGRHTPNELKVRAWADVFRESCSTMPLPFAIEIVKRHYSILDAMITPAVFVKAWAQHQSVQSSLNVDAEKSDRHCRKSECTCTHDGPCYRGWLDNDRNVAVPCPNCRRSLAKVLSEIPPPGLRKDHDMARIRTRELEHS